MKNIEIATQSRNLGAAPGLLAHDTKILSGGLEPFHQTIGMESVVACLALQIRHGVRFHTPN